MSMNGSVTLDRVRGLLAQVLGVQVEADDVDLVATGRLDSLALVELLFHIEEDFQVRVPLEELELDSLRTVRGLAGFISAAHAG
jgi:methoxymalonate biosynthesis acyl carrier protein